MPEGRGDQPGDGGWDRQHAWESLGGGRPVPREGAGSSPTMVEDLTDSSHGRRLEIISIDLPGKVVGEDNSSLRVLPGR